MVIQCCKCKRVQLDGEWNHVDIGAGLAISHTYCPPCLHETVGEMGVFKARFRESHIVAHAGRVA